MKMGITKNDKVFSTMNVSDLTDLVNHSPVGTSFIVIMGLEPITNNPLTQYNKNNVYFITSHTDSFGSTFLNFNTMNNEGMGLSFCASGGYFVTKSEHDIKEFIFERLSSYSDIESPIDKEVIYVCVEGKEEKQEEQQEQPQEKEQEEEVDIEKQISDFILSILTEDKLKELLVDFTNEKQLNINFSVTDRKKNEVSFYVEREFESLLLFEIVVNNEVVFSENLLSNEQLNIPELQQRIREDIKEYGFCENWTWNV